MIDCHSHLLPELDDGATNKYVAITMAKQAVSMGITDIIVTPHYKTAEYSVSKAEMLIALTNFKNELELNDIPLILHAGQEVRIYGELVTDLEAGNVQTLANSRYVLIEFPSTFIPSYTKRLFYDLLVAGFVPIIAHPERNQEFRNNSDLLFELVSKGALVQITAASFIGDFGRAEKRAAIKWLKQKLVHFIASDAHNATKRSYKLQKAMKKITRLTSKEEHRRLQDNTQKIIRNEALVIDSDGIGSSQRWWYRKKRRE